jgi:microsomal dipeptidase-like Zn-dependent dipeptidase
MKQVVRFGVLLFFTAAVLFFAIVPGYIDKSKNTVSIPPPHARNSWYDSIPFIADLHCDELLWDRDLLEEINYGHVDVPRMQQANMAFQVFTIVSKVPAGINIEKNDGNSDQIALLSFAQLRPPSNWFSIKKRALNQCGMLHKFAKRSEGKLRVITTKTELAQFVSDRKKDHSLTSGMLGLEGAQPLEGNRNNLEEFYNAGVRYIGLAHFYDNEWAGSAHGMNKGGLTFLGKQLIQKMDSMHVMIDLAHASQQTINDVFSLHNGPVLVSHTGVKGVCNNQRNLSDEHLIEIGKRNGLVGIGLWETAVCGKDAAATAKSIRYAVDKIGVDKVALGSDWDGAFEMHFDVTGLPLIVTALEKEGFSRSEIEMIMGGNVRDFFLRNLPE